jgi:hypothetical protein
LLYFANIQQQSDARTLDVVGVLMRLTFSSMIVALLLASTSIAHADTFTQDFTLVHSLISYGNGTGTFVLNTPPPSTGGLITYGVTPGYDLVSISVADTYQFGVATFTATNSTPPPTVLYANGVFEGIYYNDTQRDRFGVRELEINGLTYFAEVLFFPDPSNKPFDAGVVELVPTPIPEPSSMVMVVTAILAGTGLLRRRLRTQ